MFDREKGQICICTVPLVNYVSGARQQPHFPFRAYTLQSERRAGYVPLGLGLVWCWSSRVSVGTQDKKCWWIHCTRGYETNGTPCRGSSGREWIGFKKLSAGDGASKAQRPGTCSWRWICEQPNHVCVWRGSGWHASHSLWRQNKCLFWNLFIFGTSSRCYCMYWIGSCTLCVWQRWLRVRVSIQVKRERKKKDRRILTTQPLIKINKAKIRMMWSCIAAK